MTHLQFITDWDDAYSNSAHIPGSGGYLTRWPEQAAAFRAAMTTAGRAVLDQPYGDHERERYDLFLPDGAVRGTVLFVHGGYWMAFDKSAWSHLAAGPLARGWAVALPSYTLCPHSRIGGITAQIGRAVEAVAARQAGPLRLTGHSAGGHLVSRMACADAPLSAAVAERVTGVVSISGLHDLRPLMATRMNDTLRIDAAEAQTESPALLRPRANTRIVCWVGAAERPEFVRQNDLLANIWRGLGAATTAVQAAERHHFDVIDDLTDPNSALVDALLAG